MNRYRRHLTKSPRRGNARRRMSSSQTTSTATVITNTVIDSGITCVDLTEDDDDPSSIVDLTSPTDNSVIILSSTPGATPVRHYRGSERSPSVELLHQTDPDEVQVIHSSFDHRLHDVRPSKIPKPWSEDMSQNTPSSSATSDSTSAISSPTISCSICLDSLTQIKNRGETLMSTVCGHVFCKSCIKKTIAAQHLCPTCRRKLNNKNVHPVFL